MAYKKTDSAASAFDCSSWHSACPAPNIVQQEGRLWLLCPACRCVANVEAVGERITFESSKEPKQ